MDRWKIVINFLLTGLLICGGFDTYVSAFRVTDPPSEQRQESEKKREESIDKLAEKLSIYLQKPKDQILQISQARRMSPKDLVMAGIIAKKTGQPLEQIVEEKSTIGNWYEVAQKYELSMKDLKKELFHLFPRLQKEEYLAENPKIVIDTVAKYLGKKEEEIRKIWRDHPERPYGLFHAAILSKISGKPLGEVLALKTADNTWKEIAFQLQLEEGEVKKEQNALWEILRQQQGEWKETNGKIKS